MSRHCLTTLVFCLAGLLALPVSLSAQNRGPKREPLDFSRIPGLPGFKPGKPGQMPEFDPQKMFDQMFGRGGEAIDERALAKVEVSVEEESKLGKQALEAFRQQLSAQKIELVTRGKDVEYLTRLVELVRPRMTQANRYRKLHVYCMETDDPAAYSFPGGHILFSRGLVEAAQCEAGLVVTAGHELSHLDRGHLLRRTRQWKLAQQSLDGGQPSPEKMLQMMSLMPRLFERPFGPDEELDADRDGITWAYELGYDPRAVRLIFKALGERGKNGPEFLPAFLRTHPLTAERHENLHNTLTDLAAAKPNDGLYVGRENLRRRVTRDQRRFAE
jgi:predicted Zn-dependent protease